MIWEKVISRRLFLSEMFLSGTFFLSNFIISKNSLFEKLEKRLVSLFKDQESAKIMGIEYLKVVPEENNKQKLLSLLSSTLESFPGFNTEVNRSQLREWLGICRQEDFKQGRIINIQNWLLSVTELRLCALVALQPSLSTRNLARIFFLYS